MFSELETDFFFSHFCGMCICMRSVHQNFRSVNLLLNDKHELRVSDCGLAPLLLSGSACQVILCV